MKRTYKLKLYTGKFILRLVIFLGFVVLYIYRREWITSVLQNPFHAGISPLHILWAIFMVIMLFHLIPGDAKSRTMAWLKMKEENYVPVESYEELSLLRYVQAQNRRAWRVLLVWLLFNAVFGLLYLVGIIHEAELLLLTAFYFLSDYICILLFCPFQTYIMKGKCCVNCRIYDWGHFMMFTPMLFIKNFFSWSLFFMSLIVLIHWEIIYSAHPERFWEGSNRVLKCENCRDVTCAYKKKLKGEPVRGSAKA